MSTGCASTSVGAAASKEGLQMARFTSARRWFAAVTMAALVSAATVVQVMGGGGLPPYPK